MRKAITLVLIVIMLFEFMPSNHVMATSREAFNEINQGYSSYNSTSGTRTREEIAASNSQKREISKTNASFGFIGTILGCIIFVIPTVIHLLLTFVVLPENVTQAQEFTIEDLVLGRFELFDVNFTRAPRSLNEPLYVTSSTNRLVKENVAGWFYALRTFSLAALLVILIYIGIRMSMSTIASDRSKYKNMLIHWLASLVILMLLPYIIAIATNVCSLTVGIVRTMAENAMSIQVNNSQIAQTGGLNFEKTLLYGKVDESGRGFDGILTKLQKGSRMGNAFSRYSVLRFSILPG